MSWLYPIVGQDVAAGTKTTSTGSSTAAVTPNASTLAGDLVVSVCYMAGNATLAKDAGDGWLIVDSGVVGITYGIFIAACVAPRNGSSGYAGITLPASMAYTLQNYTFQIAISTTQKSPFRWDLANARRSANFWNATGSATALDAPAMNGIASASQYGIDLLGRGYNNSGTTRTVGAPATHAERFDTGQTSPPHGVVLNRVWWPSLIDNSKVQITSSISAACINRAGVRCFIPITGISNDGMRRYLHNRRYR